MPETFPVRFPVSVKSLFLPLVPRVKMERTPHKIINSGAASVEECETNNPLYRKRWRLTYVN